MRLAVRARPFFLFAASLLGLAMTSEAPTPDRRPARPEEERELTATYVPVVASTTDANGIRLVSLLSVANPHPFPMTVTAYWLPAGTDNRGFRATARPIRLPANGATRILDPLASLWRASGYASIYLESKSDPDLDGAFIVDSRLLRVVDSDATQGFSVPATLSGIASSEKGYAADIQSDARFSTDIGLFNDSSAFAAVRVEIVAEEGTVIGVKEYVLPPLSLLQDAVTNITATAFSHASLRVTSLSGGNGQIIGYVVVTDNTTRSASLSLLQPYRSPSSDARLLVVELSRYRYSPGGPTGPPIALEAGVTYELVFRSIDTAHGLSAIPQLGIEGSTNIAPGRDYVVRVAPTQEQSGTRYNFGCTRFCGAGHGGMYGSIEVQ